MGEDIQENVPFSQIAQFIHDFLQMRVKLESALPKELAQIPNRLNAISVKDEPHRTFNYILFYRISHNLYRKSNMTMGELSHVLSVQISTATRIVDWMVKDGYARRLPDLEDRRIVRVALTDTGRELHETVESYIGQHFQQVFSCLTDEQRTMLFAIMPKLISGLRKVNW